MSLLRGCPSRPSGAAWQRWCLSTRTGPEAGDRLFDLTRELETDEAMLVERIEAGSVGVVIMLERQGKFSTVNQRLLEEGCAVSSLFGSYAGTDEVRDSGMVNDWDSSKDEYYVFGPRPGSLPLSGNLSLI